MKMQVTLRNKVASDRNNKDYSCFNITILVLIAFLFLSSMFAKAEEKNLINKLVTQNINTNKTISLIRDGIT